MILVSELNKKAGKLQTSAVNIYRDYIQTLFLSAFYQQKESADFFFKGGTCLHLVYQSPRFSEDLDFSARVFNCQNFEKLLANSLEVLEKNGLKPDISESKPTSGGCFAIFSAQIEEIRLNIKIEVSLRSPKSLAREIMVLSSDFLPAFNIAVLNQNTLIKEKIQALLERKKARDVFDLYFIRRKGWKSDFLYKEKANILKAVSLYRPEQLTKDLKEFLPHSFWPLIKELPEMLKKELETTDFSPEKPIGYK